MESQNSRQPRFSRDIQNSLRQRSVRVRKMDNLHLLDGLEDNNLVTTFTLCPLYGMGDLSSSSLLAPPAGIPESRVAPKWRVLEPVIGAVEEAASGCGYTVNYRVVFADSGVIVRDQSGPQVELLDYHYRVYSEALPGVFRDRPVELYRYSELPTGFPRFINPGDPDPVSEYELKSLPGFFSDRGIELRDDALIPDCDKFSPRAEKILRKLINQLGGDSAFRREIIAQYGLFDGLNTRSGGLNFYIEREAAGLLLQLTDIFAHSRYPRIDLIC